MKTTNLTKQEFLELTNLAIKSFKKQPVGEDKGIQLIKTIEEFEDIIAEKAIYGKYGKISIFFKEEKDAYNLSNFSYTYYVANEWTLTDEEIIEGEL